MILSHFQASENAKSQELPGALPPVSQSAEHGRSQRDHASARYKMGGARLAHLILSGAPSRFRALYLASVLGAPILTPYAHNTRVQGLIFGVHVDMLQIFLCVQLPRLADWPVSPPEPSPGPSLQAAVFPQNLHDTIK